MNKLKKSSQLRESDKKILLAYANIMTDTAPKQNQETLFQKKHIKLYSQYT